MMELAVARVNALRKGNHIRVLRLLDEGGEMSVGDIVAGMGISQSWVSGILRDLAALGYVERREESKKGAWRGEEWMFYRINYITLRRVCRAISEI